MSRRGKGVVTAVSLLAVGSFLAACLITDPLPEQRRLATRRPSIDAVDPSASQVLVDFPERLLVSVRLYNPEAGFEWQFFVDFPEVSQSYVRRGGGGGPNAADVQVVDLSLEPALAGQCHKIEFVVALRFVGGHAHEADPAGADSVTWFYAPHGDFSRCSPYDAGVVDASRDAGSDADAEGGGAPP